MRDVIPIASILLVIHVVAFLIAVNVRSWIVTFFVGKIKHDVTEDEYKGILELYQGFLGKFASFDHLGMLKSDRDRRIITFSNGLVNYFKLSIALLILTLIVVGLFGF